ncbi:hypothetical protein T4B_10192 [Trichinella pseudospiralis]|uniref:Uncharacterized protein n=1 Tax=Trichinella pseudospiralis TaxID=6337 RepID=A0A0V1GBU0_TRIPS|nr:hypothetical protein T4B_10192 [Trichinella pseudospiralis]
MFESDNRICPALRRREREGELLKGQCSERKTKEKEAVLPGELYRDRLKREQARHR